jgi:hypothetical protein
MRDIDRMIDEAIYEEEGELLRQIGEEPGFFSQAFGIRRADRMGERLLMVVQTVLFVAGVWAAWMFFLAADPVTQLSWGLPAAVLLIMALMLKMMVWPAFQTNRLLREMKLIQLQLARRGDEKAPASSRYGVRRP